MVKFNPSARARTHTRTRTHACAKLSILDRAEKSLRILENNNGNTQMAHSEHVNMVLEKNQSVSVTFFLPSMLKLRSSKPQVKTNTTPLPPANATDSGIQTGYHRMSTNWFSHRAYITRPRARRKEFLHETSSTFKLHFLSSSHTWMKKWNHEYFHDHTLPSHCRHYCLFHIVLHLYAKEHHLYMAQRTIRYDVGSLAYW
jgi:hypothetical protein